MPALFWVSEPSGSPVQVRHLLNVVGRPPHGSLSPTRKAVPGLPDHSNPPLGQRKAALIAMASPKSSSRPSVRSWLPTRCGTQLVQVALGDAVQYSRHDGCDDPARTL